MRERRWDDDGANQLLDAARVVLEAAGGWEIPEDDHDDDPTRLLRCTDLLQRGRAAQDLALRRSNEQGHRSRGP
jgi:hypothetical protein